MTSKDTARLNQGLDESHAGHRPTKSAKKDQPHPHNHRHKGTKDVGQIPTSNPKSSSPHHHRQPRRIISATEIVYPSPEVATAMFHAERSQDPRHRRCPTPHISSGRIALKRSASGASFASNTSRQSGRSRRSRTGGPDGYTSDLGYMHSGLGPWDPGFGAAMGIGPVGEAIEYIGLGRKEPRHRVFQPDMLKPALRGSKRNSQVDLGQSQDAKQLPPRPMSYVGPGMGIFGPSHRSVSQPVLPHPMFGMASQPIRRRPSRPVSLSLGLGSLFAALSVDPPPNPRPGSRVEKRSPIEPADNLQRYLRDVNMPGWDQWPPSGYEGKKGFGIFGSRDRGLGAMGWEWKRRFAEAEQGRMQGRKLRFWEAIPIRDWEERILDFQEENVPEDAIPNSHRWGRQIFALHAEGFKTLEYESHENNAEDNGLLGFLTGTILETAISVLHLLRFTSQSFVFHLIPAPRPPYFDATAASAAQARRHISPASVYLWEGSGTLVLVNKDNGFDRAMIIQVRPPTVVDGNVMREFARNGKSEGWQHVRGEFCVGDVGQANLLQAQTFDDCVKNQVFFFAVTNLKQWVFGSFNTKYTKCSVGPVIDRRAREPSAMQCLTTWVIRSVDIRPRSHEAPPVPPRLSPTQANALAAQASRDRRREPLDEESPPPVPPYPSTANDAQSNTATLLQGQRDNTITTHTNPHDDRQNLPAGPTPAPHSKTRPQMRPRSASFNDFGRSVLVHPFPTQQPYHNTHPAPHHTHNHQMYQTSPPAYGLPNYFDLPPPPAPTPIPSSLNHNRSPSTGQINNHPTGLTGNGHNYVHVQGGLGYPLNYGRFTTPYNAYGLGMGP